jgi:16S rRNA (uracil1498-N3)-methyltransferase
VDDGREPDGSGGAHFFVDDLEQPVLDDQDLHHATRVLRLRSGEPITVSDGRGRWRPGRFGDEIEVAGDIVSVLAATPPLTVGFALVKGAKPELVIQKLCELGIDRIEPFVAERSVVRWDEARAGRAHERWGAIVRSAAMQSRQVRLPEVAPVAPFVAIVAGRSAGAPVAPVALADVGGRPPRRGDTRVLVGPEGGWSDAEREHGLERIAIGRNVLRAETAAIAVGAILVALRESLVEPTESADPPGE